MSGKVTNGESILKSLKKMLSPLMLLGGVLFFFGCASMEPAKVNFNSMPFKVISPDTLKSDINKYPSPFRYEGTVDGHHLFVMAAKRANGLRFLRLVAIEEKECEVCEIVERGANSSLLFNPDLLKRNAEFVEGRCVVSCLNL